MSEQFNPYNFEKALDEASKMHEKIESGEAKDYVEAERQIEEQKLKRIEETKKYIEDYFGSNARFAAGEKCSDNLAEEIFEAEVRLVNDGCKNGDEAARIMQDYFSAYVNKKLKEDCLPAGSFVTAELNWEKYKNILYVKEFEHIGGLSCCGLGFKPIMPLIEKGSNPEIKLLVEKIINNSFFMHSAGSWKKGVNISFDDYISLIEEGSFYNENGFYVTTTFSSWGEHKKHKKICLYFNDALMKIITPSSEVTKKRIFPIGEGKNISNHHQYLDGRKKFMILAGGFPSGYSRERLSGTHDEEGGDTEFISSLLSGKNHELTYFSDVLGLILEPKKIYGSGSDRIRFKMDTNDNIPILKKLLEDKLDTGVDDEIKMKRMPETRISERSKALCCPIRRIVPEILEGIIEYGENNEVLRVAIPEEGKFKVYEKNYF